MTRTPPATKWGCTKCGRAVTNGVEISFDPRYATGYCLHGSQADDAVAERVPLTALAKAESLAERRTYERAVKRARRKELAGEALSVTETTALARWQKERAEA